MEVNEKILNKLVESFIKSKDFLKMPVFDCIFMFFSFVRHDVSEN